MPYPVSSLIRLIVAATALMAGGAPASAATVRTREGKTYEGDLRLKAPAAVEVVTTGGDPVVVPLDKLDRVTVEPPSPHSAATQPDDTQSAHTQPAATQPATRPAATQPTAGNGATTRTAASTALDLEHPDAVAAVTTEAGVAFKPDEGNALRGIIGEFSKKGVHRDQKDRTRDGRAYLTDSLSPATSNEPGSWFSGYLTWDLGDGEPPEKRQSDEFSVWIWANDPSRKDYSGSVSTSVDGETFSEIPGTAFEFEFPRADNGTYNHVRYTFRPGRVTNFRYLRLKADKPPAGEESRFAQVGAFVNRLEDDARYTGVLTRGGSFLAGRVTRADATSVVLAPAVASGAAAGGAVVAALPPPRPRPSGHCRRGTWSPWCSAGSPTSPSAT